VGIDPVSKTKQKMKDISSCKNKYGSIERAARAATVFKAAWPRNALTGFIYFGKRRTQYAVNFFLTY
jgi:hypothetical protein